MDGFHDWPGALGSMGTYSHRYRCRMDKRHDVGIRFADPRRGAAVHDGRETRSKELDI